ncbi:beta-N-acetylhexosaminidase [Lutimaribacter pacificus]|uniref:beta-N-acetylhexosaminidase n=1 Tax=Lutimaribacter pacificus TaxID=391948 RepID=A0A1H0LKT1_9RHOB|nr:beta-N-acetylhexosaminidase [Lutimaribacter pacificus]SDO68848.1 beta-N-acetylhexosaminidase [Lutimaribacter pacificus]SHK05964.1 beta-N-acetylhexosaminidase [Lutimaribacter pacificus]
MTTRFGATILDAGGLRLTPEEKRFFADANPFGFILFARNIDTPEQVRALCADMREAVGRDAPITIDQEGGRVQRLRGPRWREWLPPLEHVRRAGDHAEKAMYLRYRIIADELRALGVDSNCAPMVDVATGATHAFLQNRCYGFDAAAVARIGRAVAGGMLAGGVLPVLKHIPGHGRAVVDSHFDLPVVADDPDTLRASDFAPFRALNDLPMGMTAHLVYAALDDRPATLSPRVMGLIRDEIGFDGLIMTDDISMKALSGPLPALSRAALEAGCDVILHCNGTLDERRAVADAAGPMSDAAQARAERALAARKTPDEVDIPALAAKLEALLNGRPDD